MKGSCIRAGDEIRRNRRRQDQMASDQADVVVDNYTVYGSFVVSGHGEAVVDITFPNLFTRKPMFFSGAEISPETNLTDGNFPEFNVALFSWKVDVRSANQRYWTGARVAARLLFDDPTSVSHAKFEINWMVVGKALANPVSGLDMSTGGTV